MVGNYGMAVNIDDPTPIYVQDDTPNGEDHYRCRFYLNPGGVALDKWETHDIFNLYKSGGEYGMRLWLGGRRSFANGYSLAFVFREDDYSTKTSQYYNIDSNPHLIELDYVSGSGTSGSLSLLIDGQFKQTLTGDNDQRRVDFVRLGATQSIDTVTSGTYYLDHFASNDTGEPIGE